MLGKLIKYDLKMFFRTCGPLYLIGTILAIGNGILVLSYESLDESLIWKSAINSMLVLGVLAIAAILPVAAILVISRFYKGVFGQEGYLTNTLPVTHHEIVCSKLGAAVISAVVTVIVYILQMLLFASAASKMEIYFSLYDMWHEISPFLDFSIFTWCSMILAIFTSLISTILMIYLSIAIGHLFRHRILVSVIIYYAINYIIVQPISVMVNFSLAMLVGDIGENFVLLMLANSILQSILSVVCYFITIWIMKKKLNLV